jgi:hypothetical protein
MLSDNQAVQTKGRLRAETIAVPECDERGRAVADD